MIRVNGRLSRFMYPYVFIAAVLGMWFLEMKDGITAGERFLSFILSKFPETYTVLGILLFLLVVFALGIIILAFFGAKIGKWDVNLVYGRILKKLEEMLSDMEELRKA